MTTYYYPTNLGESETIALQNLDRIATSKNAKIEDIEKCLSVVSRIRNISTLNMQVMWLAYVFYTKSNGDIINPEEQYIINNQAEINQLTTALLPLKVRDGREVQIDQWYVSISTRISSELLRYCKLIDEVI